MRLITLATLLGAGLALPLDAEPNQFSAPTPNDIPLTRRDEHKIEVVDIAGTTNAIVYKIWATIKIPDAQISTKCSAFNLLGIFNHCEDKRVKMKVNMFIHGESEVVVKYDGKSTTIKIEVECHNDNPISSIQVRLLLFTPLL